MPQIINTNVPSLTAQRNLNSSQGALQTSLQRLSSGLRINSAKDDAAGLAISERFSTQIRNQKALPRVPGTPSPRGGRRRSPLRWPAEVFSPQQIRGGRIARRLAQLQQV